jgi:dTDP-4-dehydrorhamnose 3,5-epimerase
MLIWNWQAEVLSLTEVDGLFVFNNPIPHDSRGRFIKLYSEQVLQQSELDFKIAQVNFSITEQRGTTRGLHFQMPPHGEKKIITCVRGRVFDVILDLRRHSKTFLKHVTFELDSECGKSLYVPSGCAHGFQVLDGPAEMLYAHSEEYRPDFEAGVNPTDPLVQVSWPLEIKVISERDYSFPFLDKTFRGIEQ